MYLKIKSYKTMKNKIIYLGELILVVVGALIALTADNLALMIATLVIVPVIEKVFR